MGQSNGTPYAAFDREANTLETAIDSAAANLQALGVRPVRVEMEVPAGAN